MQDLPNAVIESPRLRLAPISPSYREDIVREFTDEITVFTTPPTPESIADIDAFIEKSRREMRDGTDIVFAITKKETGEFLGCCGVHNLDTIAPAFGIWLKKSSHGNKYGQEAVGAVKKWTDEHIQYEYIRYPVAKENIASRKIPECLGGTVAREFMGKNGRGMPMEEVEYHIPRY